MLLNANAAIFQWDDDEFRFVLDQHAELDVYSANTSSLKQQFADRHVAPLSSQGCYLNKLL
jgi:hypothetical protein